MFSDHVYKYIPAMPFTTFVWRKCNGKRIEPFVVKLE